MPLHKGAKPGSKEFGENIATEIKAGKPTAQAAAIAYREARVDMSGPAFKQLTELLDRFFEEEADEPEHKEDNAENGDASLIDNECKTDGEVLMDALSTLRGRVEVAGARK